MASSFSSRPRNAEHDAFSGIEPESARRKVDESSKLFEVFINHRGPDVKQSLALDLYNSLKEFGIHAFLDCEEKELGDSFPSTIENAIHSASAHIAIFSKGYAESPWCLAELVLMLHGGAKIFPVFYEVKPSDLRYVEKGEYSEAFTKYEEKGRYMDKHKEWKEALQVVSFITGYEISSDLQGCQNIVAAIQKEVERRRRSLHVAKYPVGLHRLVKDFERVCLDQLVEDFERHCGTNEAGKEKAQIVGIFGMGGVGKTTLAKELFNRQHSHYRRACFLFDAREACANSSFPSLQKRFIRDLFQKDQLDSFQEGRPKLFQEDLFNFQSTEEGKTRIMDCINKTKDPQFLIVVDDIDHVQQLDALLIMDMLKKSVDTLVIVTTRDVGMLINAGVTTAYRLKGMDRGDARELFCWHAFGQPYPVNGYENLVNSFVNVCGGLPLSLQVLGSHVHGRDRNYWSLELNKVSKTLPRDIHRSLKISFDALDYEEQQIFLDIACFFVDKSKRIAMRVWEASGWSAQHALDALKNKCLVHEIEEEGEDRSALRMHDHLRDMGREIANVQSRSCRLWRPQDLKLLSSKGFRNILAQTKGRCFHSFLDETMRCRITYLLGESDSMVDTARVLLLLDLHFIELQRSIPPWVPLQNLRYLVIRHQTESSISSTSRISLRSLGSSIFGKLSLKTLRQSDVQFQAPTQLRVLQIYNTTLKELSDLSRIPNSFEKIIINSCNGLKSMSDLCDFENLTELNICNCSHLQELSVGHLSCLQKVVIHHCHGLKTMSGIPNLRNLVQLDIMGCPVFEQLRLVGLKNLKRLRVDNHFKLASFELEDCSSLKIISGFLNLEVLVSINIRNCPKLESLPSLENSNSLEIVTIDGCMKLKSLHLSECQKLKKVTGKFDMTQIFIRHCEELELSFLQVVTSLERITVNECGKLNRLEVHNCQNLKQLSITDCPELQELSCSSSQTKLEKIIIIRCGKMQKITLPTELVEFQVKECRELKSVAMNCDYNEGRLDSSNVARSSCLKRITIHNCDQLQIVQGIDELPALKRVQFISCGNLVTRTFISKLKSVPQELFFVGKAVDGALSILNPTLFSDTDVLISESTTSTITRRQTQCESSVVIYCAVVVNTSIENLHFSPNALVQQGEWIITGLPTNWYSLHQFEDVTRNGQMKKLCIMDIKKGGEWKFHHVLHTIVDKLYHN